MGNYVSLTRAYNWLAFRNLSGEFDESTSPGFVGGDGKVSIFRDDDSDLHRSVGKLELAEDLVRAAIDAGKLALFGIPDPIDETPRSSDSWEQLPVEFCRAATIDWGDGGMIAYVEDRQYSDLYVDFGELQSLWPFWPPENFEGSKTERPAGLGDPAAPNGDILNPGRMTIRLEKQCAEHLLVLVKEHEGVPPIKSAVLKIMRERLPNISNRAFDRCWSNYAPRTWREPGRRPIRRPFDGGR